MAERLYRSKQDQIIAGVCSGLGDYFDIDPTFIRAIFVVTALAGGAGILAYLVLMIVIPERPDGKKDEKITGIITSWDLGAI